VSVFVFDPLDFVTVTVHGVNYRGRVVRCIHEARAELYDIEYVDDRGDFKRGEFHADELEVKA
jgi:hypothetical protein